MCMMDHKTAAPTLFLLLFVSFVYLVCAFNQLFDEVIAAHHSSEPATLYLEALDRLSSLSLH
jgi:hypothetical protein